MPSQSLRSGGDPHHEYTQRRSDRQEQAARQFRRERLVGNARVVVFLLGLVAGYFALATPYLHPGWLAPFVVGFGALLFAHESVTRAWHRATRAVGFYDASLERLGDDWRGKGQQGLEYQDEKHPYAADIDLFGSGSLFELLCTARTRTGEDTLAGWLRGPAAPDEIRARQAAVAELCDQLDLREDLALLGSDLPIGVDFSGVAAWGRSPVLLKGWWPCLVALVLGVAAMVCLGGWLYALFSVPVPDEPLDFWQRVGALPFAGVLILEGGFAALFFRRVQSVLASVGQRGRDLAMLSAVLACLEKATFRSPRLVELQRDLTEGDHTGSPPSQRIAALGNLIDLLNSQRNQYFMLFALLLLWGTQMAHAVERWRSHSGPSIGRWLDIVGQFEALCALAAFAHANPANPFPEIVEAGPVYDAEGLGHPLRPGGPGVRNDLKLGEATHVLIVSGSNMSGKSTFLRTIGVNAVLALAGAPVLARRMRISPLALGATLRIQDSLQEGRSRFYAEILRVKQVVDISRGPIPLLFLLDEIFAGTNSHDRCIGAEGVVRGLAATGAIGLVTTHDLTLTHITDSLGGKGSNVHFADQFDEGTLQFDYQLREGVVKNSNALALMRAVGLEV